MSKAEMISMKEILKIVHLKMGYDVDRFTEEVLKSLDDKGISHHIVKKEKMREYIDNYILRKYKEKNNGEEPKDNNAKDSIIIIEGSTQAMRYSKDGILEMLEDERIIELLTKRLIDSSVRDGDTLLPTELATYHIAKLNGILKSKKDIDFYTEIKNDSLEEKKQKLLILQKTIDIIEMIQEVSQDELEKQFKESERHYKGENVKSNVELSFGDSKLQDFNLDGDEFNEIENSYSPESNYSMRNEEL